MGKERDPQWRQTLQQALDDVSKSVAAPQR